MAHLIPAADGRTGVAMGCPDCRGGLGEIRDGDDVQYVCQVGHSWSPQSFVAATENDIEDALWTAVSAMQEKVTALRGLAERSHDPAARLRYLEEVRRVDRAAVLVRSQARRETRASQPPAE
ncbi:hypothetical protein [Actinoplanes sp. M2I2]|uniref:hypothetical protein n=1 Tax=Actinoplanes sp. M2I2 TaxID=1734444 RepID=UPI0020228048|nr:hypothetical protein [Actinoplanes sp. M2I2]